MIEKRCKFCRELFYPSRKRIKFCSQKCFYKSRVGFKPTKKQLEGLEYGRFKNGHSIRNTGRTRFKKGSSGFIGKHSEKTKMIISEKSKRMWSNSRIRKVLLKKLRLRGPVSKETREKMSAASTGRKRTTEDIWKTSGERHYNWQGGKSFEPYGLEFNGELREQIRKRDACRCQQCFRHQDELYTKSGRKYRLIVHHIDYDKKNNNPENLISLCMGCHFQTNFSREDWTKYFRDKTDGNYQPLYPKEEGEK